MKTWQDNNTIDAQKRRKRNERGRKRKKMKERKERRREGRRKEGKKKGRKGSLVYVSSRIRNFSHHPNTH